MAVNRLFLFFFFAALSLYAPTLASAKDGVPSSVIAFGDSLLDPGNNNVLRNTLIHANHRPYGRDFPGQKPTGRFSDGMIMGDLVISSLGIKETLPAYLDPDLKDADLVTGVSFASAGSGFDDLTAVEVDVFTMDSQLAYFKEYITRLEGVVGKEKAKESIKDMLFLITAGSNDIMGYNGIISIRRMQYTLPEYHDFLLERLSSFVQKVYDMGGRRFAISGLPPLGSVPVMLLMGADTNKINKGVVSYNQKLQSLIVTMMSTHNGTKMTYADSYTDLNDMIQNPQKYSFINSKHGCCGLVNMEMGPFCNNIVPICDDPSKYIFWDAVHPTQYVYKAIMAGKIMKSSLLSITS